LSGNRLAYFMRGRTRVTDKRRNRTATRWLAAGAGAAVGGYAALVARAWLRYGHVTPGTDGERDALLDGVMPEYEIVERHHVRVRAPVDVTFAAANAIDFQRSAIARAIFKTRELVMGSHPTDPLQSGDLPGSPGPSGPAGSFLAQMHTIGWGELARTPGREVVMGAVTQPWQADVVFHPLPPAEFTAFREPGYVKIAWTLRADPVSANESIFRTETRAVATDPVARAKFRRYWSFVSPGIIVIRWMLLGPLKRDAEGQSAPRLSSPEWPHTLW
jgi:hypothetical protein